MTLFVPALVAATSAAARPVAAPSRPRDVDDHADDDPTLARDAAPSTPLAEAVRAIGEDAMTRVFAFRGDAMAPTLRGGARARDGDDDDGARATSSGRARRESRAEYVLARRLAHPFRSAAIGDVVVLAHPSDSTRTLIRRVSATEGDELVDAANASVYVVPRDHAWVTADADAEMDAATGGGRHEDSRSFGPVDARALEWRVMYSMRSATDHAAVENSAAARVADAPVLEAELAKAMEALGWAGEGEGGGGGEGD